MQPTARRQVLFIRKTSSELCIYQNILVVMRILSYVAPTERLRVDLKALCKHGKCILSQMEKPGHMEVKCLLITEDNHFLLL